MQLSVVNGVFGGVTLDESLKFLSDKGVKQLELGVGGYPGTVHADAKVLIKDEKKRKELMDTFAKYGMTISALSVHFGLCSFEFLHSVHGLKQFFYLLLTQLMIK
jgi:sugar phosphate isomerase/epimerase